ncbi:MAG: hypothetical protein ABS939_00285 [Psychrobacillus sp.]
MNFGWKRGTLLTIDSQHNQLWEKWFYLLEKGSFVEGDPFPYVELAERVDDVTYKQLENCYQSVYHLGISSHDFIDWICYAIGLSWCSDKPKVSEEAHNILDASFPWKSLISKPADYLSYFLAKNGASGVLDYYPTPSALSVCMAKMMEPSLRESVIEPCIGAGGIILNVNTLNMVGMDLNLLMVKAACIQAFFYKPQLLYAPTPLTNVHLNDIGQVNGYFEFDTDTRIYKGDSLLGEFYAPKHIFRKDSELVSIYVQPRRERNRAIHQVQGFTNSDWLTLSKADRFQVVKAFARELPFDCILTNPPFNLKLGGEYKKMLEKINKDNENFLNEMYPEPSIKKAPEMRQLQLF